MRALEVECGVVREGLVRNFSASWQGQAFCVVPRVDGRLAYGLGRSLPR